MVGIGDVLIIVFMYVFIIFATLLSEYTTDNDNDTFSSVILTIVAVGLMIFETIFSSFVMKEYFGSFIYIIMVPLIISMWIFILKSGDVYDWLVVKINAKMRNRSISKTLSKNYSRQHANLILKFYKLLINGKHARKRDNDLLLFNPYENRILYYEVNGNNEYYKVDIISLLVEFVNINIKYANNKDYAESVESILLEKDNAKRVVFLLNVFEDKEKLNFLSTEEGIKQLKLIGKDLTILNCSIQSKLQEFISINKKTKANKMNEDFNLLRKNSFDKIEEMRRD